MSCDKKIKIFSSFLFLLVLIFPTKEIFGQGNIYGNVTNSDASTPSNGEISFIGYLEGTDEEIKIESCVGAGYDNGNWYDNLPNYLTATAGDQFNFHFYNSINGEGANLNSIIKIGSFQQEDISLSFITRPEKPDELTGKGISGPSVEINWVSVSGLTYHIYRRQDPSNGSFFRLDDPSGNLSNPGVVSGPFIDNTVDGASLYDYLIIAENSAGDLSPHSAVITISSKAFMCGDVDNSGKIDILDIVFLINFRYKGGPAPEFMASAEVNNDGRLDILDVVHLINFRYKSGPDLICPDEFEYP
ncbi:MAG: hypothetical protein GY865_12355 [candidate division Zixibacteria bacterium]|nr:hypothetical protein [candidate division Zixibacteria bacterium]